MKVFRLRSLLRTVIQLTDLDLFVYPQDHANQGANATLLRRVHASMLLAQVILIPL